MKFKKTWKWSLFAIEAAIFVLFLGCWLFHWAIFGEWEFIPWILRFLFASILVVIAFFLFIIARVLLSGNNAEGGKKPERK